MTDMIQIDEQIAKLTAASMKNESHEANWNPWLGCRKCSAMCKNCLMFLTQGERFKNFGHQAIHDPANIRRVWSNYGIPMKLQKLARERGKKIVCSVCMYSDFFLEEADPWRPKVWRLIRITPNVVYKIQTKRTERITSCLPSDWGPRGYPNVWFGASVETKKYFYRLDDLRAIPCALRYVDNAGTLEDIMPEFESQLDGIGWVISGGETGCGVVDPRPWSLDWAKKIHDACVRRGIPFWGGHIAGRGRCLPHLKIDGKECREMPVV